jgi:hypothetical protein
MRPSVYYFDAGASADVALGGCGELRQHTPASSTITPTAVRGMLIAMTDEHKINSTGEAAEAKERATRTESMMASLLRELRIPDLSQRELDAKEQEIERLRKQYNREMESVREFSEQLARKVAKDERLFRLKDPVIERIRKEMMGIIENKDGDVLEIRRLREEFERRREELEDSSQ